MVTQIKFGTSGWRAVMADEFTFLNVRRAVNGIARYVRSQDASGARVIIGRDPRFLGETFCAMTADILSSYGITPLVIADAAPTPAIAYAVIRENANGAINFTASHNPPEYNGIKFSTLDGAPALPEVTRQIEAAIPEVDPARVAAGAPAAPGRSEEIHPQALDPRGPYLARLQQIIDFNIIHRAALRVVYDPLWGAARGYPDSLLRDAAVETATVHDTRDVLFGGHAPEPDDHLLRALREKMHATKAHIGIATDGDADRFGILDEDGTFLQPNYIIALARHHKVELYETPVGFKYIGELIKQDKITIGGEESAGLSIRHHVPEKDGVLAGLLCCEAVARRKKSIGEQIKDLFGKVGSFYARRENFSLTPEVKAKFTSKMKSDPAELSGRKVKQLVRSDGLKVILDDGSWVCYRVSGTEPVVRVYSEAKSEQDLARLAAAAKDWISQ